MSLPARILSLLAALAVSFIAGWGLATRHAHDAALALQLQQSEKAREDDHDRAVTEIHRLDNYAAAQAKSTARALPARDDLASVQHSLAAIAAEAPASSCSPDPRFSGLADLLREGSSLVEEGARHVDELRDQRDALKAAGDAVPAVW